MRRIDDETSKKILFTMLQEIKRICDENEIVYYLGYGTLLGAVRHKGFIPWDDDIDVLMPRPDYNRFLKTCNSDLFDVLSIETNQEYNCNFAKASHKGSIIKVDNVRETVDMGLCIDIFPIDGVGNSMKEAISFFRNNTFLYGLSISARWERYVPGRSKKITSRVLRHVSYYLSRIFNSRTIVEKHNMAVSKKDYNLCNYVAVCVSPYREKEIMSKEIFGKPTKVSFEGDIFKAPERYTSYLTKLYGDYMKLPPKNQRKHIHDDIAFFR